MQPHEATQTGALCNKNHSFSASTYCSPLNIWWISTQPYLTRRIFFPVEFWFLFLICARVFHPVRFYLPYIMHILHDSVDTLKVHLMQLFLVYLMLLVRAHIGCWHCRCVAIRSIKHKQMTYTGKYEILHGFGCMLSWDCVHLFAWFYANQRISPELNSCSCCCCRIFSM